ncbi:hypothetical protein [Amycolatopsis saalfeldensis]|uniref:Uncharacterized protein n=1 Tax=Amycolatopsis saalfeldensis TaxID=394193 RepID=A0A1H8RND8_9PSEU|nr:hypothetical protein [Amycolatopsis saalfeldensis]SEO67866.1 hypothetical protein SAMN04489732_101874 [Amycolatopsis saalfeldensis]
MLATAKLRRVVVPAALVTMLAGTAACGGPAATSAAGGDSPAAAPSTTAGTAPSATTPGGDEAKGSATPEALMTVFVTDVLQQHYRKACLLNTAPPNSNLDPAKACAQPEATKP